MFGLFDPPKVKVRERVPIAMHSELDLIVATVEAMPQLMGLTPAQVQMVVGIVLSVWSSNSAAMRRFDISEKNYIYLRDLGSNCARFLGDDIERAEQILSQLIKAKMVPHHGTESDEDPPGTEAAEEGAPTVPAPAAPSTPAPTPEEPSPILQLHNPISKAAYLAKHRISEQKLDGAIGLGKIKACWHDGGLWVEDKRV